VDRIRPALFDQAVDDCLDNDVSETSKTLTAPFGATLFLLQVPRAAEASGRR
jgi:hypothetical protein